MQDGKWSDEQSALFVAEVNLGIIRKAIAFLFLVLLLVMGATALFGDTSFWGLAMGVSLIPMYPMMEYVVVLYSVTNKLKLETGRRLFFADRAGYRAKLKANPELRAYKPTRNQKLIAWVTVALLAVLLAWALQN